MKRLALWSLLMVSALPLNATQHPSYIDEQQVLMLCNKAPVHALRFIHVGEASLWRDSCDSEEQNSALQPPLLLEFAYQRNVPGSAFARAATTMIERNIDSAEFRALADRLEAFNSHYIAIGSGDRYQLRYLADGTLDLLLNDSLLASEKGHEFAQSYLSIWFGDQPYSERMKEQLLAKQ
ncbi:MAG: hypothetical protein CVV10_08815 [Gammaproteobacteria bacterium HGW-Gammaproteobacteria-14]|nr:MAG: hypothetical protein CVV10_08815 [Gammaproteobacteria bacterium HGW-Gammaproteobacteria-14]